MKTRIGIIVIVFLLIVAAGMAIFAWKSKPELIEFSPQMGAVNVPSASPIRLVFSHAMVQETVNTRLKINPVMVGTFSWDKDTLTFNPDHPWPGGQEINVTLEDGARSTSWISFPMGKHNWSFKTSEEMLAYLWPSYGKAELYALDPVTGEVHQFTRGMDVLDYSINSDGRIFYFSARNLRGGADLYRIDRTKLLGPANNLYQVEQILDCTLVQCRSPQVSFDNRLLAYEYILPIPSGDAGPAQIWLLDLTTMQAKPAGKETHETVQPSWSPTGLLAYYDRTSNGYEVFDPATQQRTQIPNQTGQPGAWSPSGEYYLAPEISYFPGANGTEIGTSHLMRYGNQSGTVEDISGSDMVEDVGPCYAPDGSLIAFTRKFLDAEHWTIGRQIWMMNADGSNPHPITDEADYNHYDLTWSKDGQNLAYGRFNQAKLSDEAELWIINIDSSNALQLVIGGYSPVWIP